MALKVRQNAEPFNSHTRLWVTVPSEKLNSPRHTHSDVLPKRPNNKMAASPFEAAILLFSFRFFGKQTMEQAIEPIGTGYEQNIQYGYDQHVEDRG